MAAESRGDHSQSSGFTRDLRAPRMTWQQHTIDLAQRMWRPLTFVIILGGSIGAILGTLEGMDYTEYSLLILAFFVAGYLLAGCIVHVKLPFATPFKIEPEHAYIEVSKAIKPRAIRLRDNWPQIAVNAHLASSVDILRQRGPHLRAIQQTPEGLALFVSVASGDSALKLIQAAPNLASAIGLRQLLSAENNQLMVKFIDPVNDALEESISLASVRYGSVTNQALADSLHTSSQPNISLGFTALSKAVVIPMDVAQHVAWQGQSRSGKSVALYSFLAQIRSNKYADVTGIDPTGALPSNQDRVPWVLASDGGIGLPDLSRWLDEIEKTLNQRLSALRKAHYLDKFEWDDTEHPLLVVVFEEFPGVLRSLKLAETGLKPAERVSDRLKAIFGRLLMEALKVNIRVVVVAQRADAEFLGGAERAQIACRVTFKVDNQDAVKMFHESVSGHDWETLRNAAPGVGIIEQVGQPQTIFRAFNMGFVEYRDIVGPVPEPIAVTDESSPV